MHRSSSTRYRRLSRESGPKAGSARAGSVNTRCANPALVAFILDRYNRNLPPGIRVFMRLHDSRAIRRFPIGGELTVVRDTHGGLHAVRPNIFSEFTHPPFAFGLAQMGSYPHSAEITHFSNFGYDDSTDITLALPIGRGTLPYPGS